MDRVAGTGGDSAIFGRIAWPIVPGSDVEKAARAPMTHRCTPYGEPFPNGDTSTLERPDWTTMVARADEFPPDDGLIQ
jgi:hypothetical protein